MSSTPSPDAAADWPPPTASWLRRIVALIIDWFACTLVVVLGLGPLGWSDDRFSSFYTLGLFILESAVLTAFAGGSFGQLLTRIRVVRYDQPTSVDLLRCVFRQILVALVIPPLVFRPDGRGLHDMLTNSTTTPLEELLARRPG